MMIALALGAAAFAIGFLYKDLTRTAPRPDLEYHGAAHHARTRFLRERGEP